MTSIVQISDTHFGTEIPSVVNSIKQAISKISPDIIILSGDITQRAKLSQFKAAAEFMASLPARTKIAIPGNHDIPLFNVFARFCTPYNNFKKIFGPRESIIVNDEVSIVALDATNPFRHTKGKLENKRILPHIQKVDKSSIIVICAHQPLFTSWREDEHETLINRHQTAELFAEQKADIVLSGHIHVPLAITTQSAFPELSRHFVLSGAGTAVSRRTRPGAPNSFNHIVAQKDKISITLLSYNSELNTFTPTQQSDFTNGSNGWSKI